MDFAMFIVVTVLLVGLIVFGVRRRHEAAWRRRVNIPGWESLCSLLPLGIGFCDGNLFLRHANPAFRKMFATTNAQKADTLHATEWLDEAEALKPLLVRALSGEQDISGRVTQKNGASCMAHVRRIATENGAPMLSIVCQPFDNSLSSAGQEFTANADDSASANSWKDAQIVRISHDLRDPLNAMLGWLHLLEASKIPNEELLPTIRRIQKDARRQGGLIDELRKLARPV